MEFKKSNLTKYIVGGYVRDQLLGIEPRDKDWVVTGATEAQMLALGFQKVGADFPVFLESESHEEYALARIERKTGHGYHGFSTDFSPTVSLEEDLKRRDLTINAMALSEQGEVIDPYGGQKDLQQKVLRHVSEAFSEDPVRVLRVARFYARLGKYGFSVAEETQDLMRYMVQQGELDHLTAERVWAECFNALQEPEPYRFFELLFSVGASEVLFPEICALLHSKAPEQSEKKLSFLLKDVQKARDLQSSPLFLFSYLMRKLSECAAELPLDQKEKTIKALCLRLRVPHKYKDMSLKGVRYAKIVQDVCHSPAQEIVQVVDAFRSMETDDLFQLFLKMCLVDKKRGVKGQTWWDILEFKFFMTCLDRVQSLKAQKYIAQGLVGAEIGRALTQEKENLIAEEQQKFCLALAKEGQLDG